jgi:hypothetical protein
MIAQLVLKSQLHFLLSAWVVERRAQYYPRRTAYQAFNYPFVQSVSSCISVSLHSKHIRHDYDC